jgi:serine/threonine protein kinase
VFKWEDLKLGAKLGQEWGGESKWIFNSYFVRICDIHNVFQVYRIKCRSNIFAGKRLFSNNSQELLEKEAEIHSKCDNHPNIVHLIGYAQSTNNHSNLFLLMELCTEGSLCDFLTSDHGKSLNWTNKYLLGLDIVAGLECIHKIG